MRSWKIIGLLVLTFEVTIEIIKIALTNTLSQNNPY